MELMMPFVEHKTQIKWWRSCIREDENPFKSLTLCTSIVILQQDPYLRQCMKHCHIMLNT